VLGYFFNICLHSAGFTFHQFAIVFINSGFQVVKIDPILVVIDEFSRAV